MSYIRTKNSIYQVESVLRDNGFVKGYNVGEMAFIRKDQVIKQSENLEELCDEYCYIKYDVISQYLTIDFKFKRDDEFCALRNKLTANGIAEISKGISKYELENGELKFAIWTEWGLKYVAKMDNEGKLVLI